MATDFDTQIEALRQDIEALRMPLTDEWSTFVSAAATWAATFWQQQARSVVLAYPELAARRADDGSLRELRARVDQLVTDAELHAQHDLVEEPASSRKWPHLIENMGQDDGTDHGWDAHPRSAFRIDKDDNDGPSITRSATVRLKKRLIPLLDEYGFRHSSTVIHGMDYDYDYGPWSPEMLAAVSRYAEIHLTLLEKRAALKKVSHEKAVAQAAAAWDEAV